MKGFIGMLSFLDSREILYSVIWRTTKLFSKVAAPFKIPASIEWGFWFLYILINTCYYLFYSSCPCGCEVASHYGFNLHFPGGQWYWASFHLFIGHLYIIFREIPIQIPCLFLYFLNIYLFLAEDLSLWCTGSLLWCAGFSLVVAHGLQSAWAL